LFACQPRTTLYARIMLLLQVTVIKSPHRSVMPMRTRTRLAFLVVITCLVSATATPVVQAQAPAKGTQILWDRYGVPHIVAPDHPSLFYAYGYAQMEAHSELLLRLYAQARGRGAEYYGETYLASDRWVRTNGIPDTARKWAAGQSAEFGP